MKYDSTKDTLAHIGVVRTYLMDFAILLLLRAQRHDESKLADPKEKELYDKYTPLLSSLTFGSKEYMDNLEKLKPALDRHYASNSHHPQHYENGIDGMTLVDVVEMLLDWLAATQRHEDGDIYNSIEINADRFGISDQLKKILQNTIWEYF